MDRVRTGRVAASSLLAREECPPWCEQQHLGRIGDRFGFHHDGETTAIALEDVVAPGQPVDLLVNVSQHAQEGSPPEPSLVEMQDEARTLCLLTPVECLRLARALLENAGVVAGELSDAQDYRDELVGLVADLLDGAGLPVVAPAPRWRADTPSPARRLEDLVREPSHPTAGWWRADVPVSSNGRTSAR